ncbi:Hypothetical_protein [Hexamita inflata]|uniref:Hypothetical_protein n=1 Tax=Hexamita inflata TaxID=28002 RepID=A0AA86PT43_9EUKA|nr:Hypothetical protein HINF_LOCUS33470 [Hexamita inflata]CAI9966363.1 Hypothetical protein HINF_LOCUS54008 [Hexamita inflata]
MERQCFTLEQQFILEAGFVDMLNQYCKTCFINFSSAINYYKDLSNTLTSKFNWKQLGEIAGFKGDDARTKSLKYINNLIIHYRTFNEQVIPAFIENQAEQIQIFSDHVKELSFCDSPLLCPNQESFQE